MFAILALYMRRRQQKTQVTAPPVEELKKGRGCLKRSCSAGCGCLAFFGIGGLIFMSLTARTRLVTLKDIPEHIKIDVPLYDIENVTKRKTLKRPAPGSIARRIQEQFPPLKTFFNRGTPDELPDDTSRYLFEWSDVIAKPEFVASYYHDRLMDAGYRLEQRWTEDNRTIIFSDQDGYTRGWIKITAISAGHTKISMTLDIAS